MQTEGEVRDMTEEEKKKAPDGSFTLVEITKLKKQYSGAQGWKTIRIKQLLADIYYPYIYLDYGIANSSLSFPIQFEVNGQNLVEVMDCEFGITNLHSGNGDPFLIDLELTAFTDDPAVGARSRAQNKEKAHAQIQCQYFPNQKGKEMLDTILEELEGQGLTSKTFENMPRVAVRWLGRLLPDNNWGTLPFMKISPKKIRDGWKLHWGK
jgi:hypothetical protein